MSDAVTCGRDIVLHFGQTDLRKQVLHVVGVSMNAGEIVLPTGPSGSGKTTLPTLICGLRSMQSGSLTVLGREMSAAENGRGPELILADEPTASLDREPGPEVADLLERLAHASGCGVLLVTHDERVHHIADRAMRMEGGRMVA